MNSINRPIRIAIQSGGRLKGPSLSFVRSLGVEFDLDDARSLVVRCSNIEAELVFVRHGDIPQYIANGTVDFGIVGENLVLERGLTVPAVRELGFGECCLVLAVPNDSGITSIADLDGRRIATTYPNSLKKFLAENGIDASVIKMNGSVEVAPSLGLADGICDITQSGSTLKANGLRELATVLGSQALFVESPFENSQKAAFKERFVTVTA